MDKPTIYIVSDGKPGHLAQTRGLAAAIGARIPVRVSQLDANKHHLIVDRSQQHVGLVLAAGHKTYRYALRLGKKISLPTIALMDPGWLSRRRFDLCIIPRHDGIAKSNNIIVTDGALNTITPAKSASSDESLLLIGGPSRHHHWEDASMLAQLHTLLARDKHLRWTVTGSRRTPASTDRLLRECADEQGERFVYTPASQTPPGWVAEQLQRCGQCWVSEDSVSMVYESLSAGARVGLLNVPRKSSKPGRVVRGVLSLIERGWVTTFDDWRDGKPLPVDRPPLVEADRVAKLVLERFPLSEHEA